MEFVPEAVKNSVEITSYQSRIHVKNKRFSDYDHADKNRNSLSSFLGETHLFGRLEHGVPENLPKKTSREVASD